MLASGLFQLTAHKLSFAQPHLHYHPTAVPTMTLGTWALFQNHKPLDFDDLSSSLLKPSDQSTIDSRDVSGHSVPLFCPTNAYLSGRNNVRYLQGDMVLPNLQSPG